MHFCFILLVVNRLEPWFLVTWLECESEAVPEHNLWGGHHHHHHHANAATGEQNKPPRTPPHPPVESFEPESSVDKLQWRLVILLFCLATTATISFNRLCSGNTVRGLHDELINSAPCRQKHWWWWKCKRITREKNRQNPIINPVRDLALFQVWDQN